MLVSQHSIAEPGQLAAATQRHAFHQRRRSNPMCPQCGESRVILADRTQHLLLAPIQVLAHIDTRRKSALADSHQHHQARFQRQRLAHSRAQLVKHLKRKNIQRWPIQHQPENAIL